MVGGWMKLTIRAEHLSRHDLLIEVGLALLDTGRESFLFGLVNPGLDGISLSARRSFGLLLLSPELSTLVSSQVTTELGIAASAVVEVEGISCRARIG
jgi:hypothetical protein